MTMYLGAACGDFKTDRGKVVPVSGQGCSGGGRRARVGSPRSVGREGLLVRDGDHAGGKAARKGHAQALRYGSCTVSREVKKTSMSGFSFQEVVAQTQQPEAPRGARCVLGAHACRGAGSSAPSGPKPARQENYEPSSAEPAARALLSRQQGRCSVGSRAEDRKLQRRLWATHYGMEVKGSVFLSQMLMRDGEKEQKYGQESKNMTCHLATLMCIIIVATYFFLLRDYDGLVILYRKGKSKFSRLKLY